MPYLNLNALDPFGGTWYCFEHQQYCKKCNMWGVCEIDRCPLVPEWIARGTTGAMMDEDFHAT